MTAEQKAQLEDVLAELVDFGEMSRELGRRWKDHSAQEQTTFVEKFERLLRASSVRDVGVYRNKTIEYGHESIEGDRGSVLTTVASEESLTDVTYQFRRVEGGWSIVDYDIDGISMVRNYRRQFRKLIKKKGWDGLLQRLDDRSTTLERGEQDESDESDES